MWSVFETLNCLDKQQKSHWSKLCTTRKTCCMQYICLPGTKWMACIDFIKAAFTPFSVPLFLLSLLPLCSFPYYPSCNPVPFPFIPWPSGHSPLFLPQGLGIESLLDGSLGITPGNLSNLKYNWVEWIPVHFAKRVLLSSFQFSSAQGVAVKYAIALMLLSICSSFWRNLRLSGERL